MNKGPDRIWKLLAKQLAGEAAEKESEELRALLRQYPDLGYPVQIVEDLFKSTPPEEQDPGIAFGKLMDRAWQKISDATNQDQSATTPTDATSMSSSPSDLPAVSNLKTTSFPLASSLLKVSPLDHLKTNAKIAFRSLARNRTFSFINIAGLAIGMASAILLLLWIQRQMSYDQFHTKKDRTYLVYTRANINGKIEAWPTTPHLLGPTLKKEYPQVEEMTRMNWVGAFVLSNGDKHLQTQGFLTDPGFFKIFDFPLKEGNPEKAFDQPHSIVLTEKLAKKLFGEEDAYGRTIRLDSNADFTVTGVMKDLPGNTEFDFEYLVPWSYTKEVHWEDTKWGTTSIRTYALLKPNVSEVTANRLFKNVIKDHAPEVQNELFVHPMTKWRLYSEFENGKISGGIIDIVHLFMIVAGLILLIACINYMNLSTARSAKAAREVGIRKVVGAGKASLIGRFLGESVLVAFLAGVLSLVIVRCSLSWFNDLSGECLQIPYTTPVFWLSGLAFILFTGLLAGSYPAFYLSAYKPISVLKGYFKSAHALVTPRKVLVVLQFTFAIAFIICTIIIYNQIGFVRDRNKGYSQDNLAFVYIKGDIRKNMGPIKSELLSSGAITNLTCTSSPITDVWDIEDNYSWEGKDPNLRTETIVYRTSGNFIGTMGMQLLAGRDIDPDKYPTDSTALIINESAVKLAGFTNPIGKTFKSNDGSWHVVGVVKDFVTGNPYSRLLPTVIQGPKLDMGTISFRLNEGQPIKTDLDKITAIFTKYNPDYPFEYKMTADMYKERFRGEQHFGTLAALFAGLAIFISCLGLFALAAYMAESRIKEVGVRKVLGASVTGITTLLSKDFLLLVFVSFLIASPIAWWCMNRWLENYPYHVSISWTVFAFTGLLSVFIAVVTVSYQSVRAALMSPAISLRSE